MRSVGLSRQNRIKEGSLNDKRQQYIHQLISANRKEQKAEESPARIEPNDEDSEAPYT